MQLPEDDQAFLEEKSFTWELLPGVGKAHLVIKSYPVCETVFDRSSVDLMILIPNGYPMAALDMFYVDPPLRLKASGAYPTKTGHFEKHVERQWQRFSRHLQASPWRPGVDGLRTFMAPIAKELQAKG